MSIFKPKSTPPPMGCPGGLEVITQRAFDALEGNNLVGAALYFCDLLPTLITSPVSTWHPGTVWTALEVNNVLYDDAEIAAGFLANNLDQIPSLKLLACELLNTLLMLAIHKMYYASPEEMAGINALGKDGKFLTVDQQCKRLSDRKAFLQANLSGF